MEDAPGGKVTDTNWKLAALPYLAVTWAPILLFTLSKQILLLPLSTLTGIPFNKSGDVHRFGLSINLSNSIGQQMESI